MRNWTCTAQGTVAVTPATAGTAAPGFATGVQTATVTVPLKAFRCPNDEMTQHLNEAMHADKFPEIVYRLEKYEMAGAQAQASGTMTITGVSQPVSVPVTLTPSDKGVQIEGNTRLEFADLQHRAADRVPRHAEGRAADPDRLQGRRQPLIGAPLMPSLRAEWRYVAGLVAFFAVAAAVTGAGRDVPVIDDWTYAWSVEQLLEHGRLAVLDWSSVYPVGPAAWGAAWSLVFGFSFGTLRVSTLALAAVGCGALYFLLRELEASPRVALFGALTVAANPAFLLLASSFMTDVPFVALTLLALVGYTRAIRRDAPHLLWWAGLWACLSCLERQIGVHDAGRRPAPAAAAAGTADPDRRGAAARRHLAGDAGRLVGRRVGDAAHRRDGAAERPAALLVHAVARHLPHLQPLRLRADRVLRAAGAAGDGRGPRPVAARGRCCWWSPSWPP